MNHFGGILSICILFLLSVIIVGKWQILDIVDEGVDSEARALLVYCGFHGKNVNDACYLSEWIAWDSFKFEKASRVYR